MAIDFKNYLERENKNLEYIMEKQQNEKKERQLKKIEHEIARLQISIK